MYFSHAFIHPWRRDPIFPAWKDLHECIINGKFPHVYLPGTHPPYFGSLYSYLQGLLDFSISSFAILLIYLLTVLGLNHSAGTDWRPCKEVECGIKDRFDHPTLNNSPAWGELAKFSKMEGVIADGRIYIYWGTKESKCVVGLACTEWILTQSMSFFFVFDSYVIESLTSNWRTCQTTGQQLGWGALELLGRESVSSPLSLRPSSSVQEERKKERCR